MLVPFETFAWEHGYRFEEAIRHWTPTEIFSAVARAAPTQQRSLAAHLTVAGREAIRRERAAAEAAYRDAFEWLRDRAIGGELVVYGFESPRRHSSTAVQLGVRTLQGPINWLSGTVSHEGLHYEQLRMLQESALDELRERWKRSTGAPQAAKPVGRPSTAHLIVDAFHALCDTDQIKTKSLRSNYPNIRHWLKIHHPDKGFAGTGPSDEAIRDVLSEEFKRFRSAKAA